MFSVDDNRARTFLTDQQWQAAREKTELASRSLDTRSGKGAEWLGWRDILAHPNMGLLDNMTHIGSEIHNQADVLVVCGIGGSYLGAKAVIDALGEQSPGKTPEILYAGHHMSGRYLRQLIATLEQPRADGGKKEVFLNVISKSGTTIETALAFRELRAWMHKRYGDGAVSRIFCTTSKEGGALNKIIQVYGYRKFILPDDVGGRFSVLTPVGLLPVAAAGISVKELFSGALQAYNQFETDRTRLCDYVATRYALYKKGFAIDLLATFEPDLISLACWLQQLYGESEGKNAKGLFPATAAYSTDLHSIGQMVQDGQRNIMETFLRVHEPEPTVLVGSENGDYDGLNYLAGKSLEQINDTAYEGTVIAHTEGGVPVFAGTLQQLNAQSLGFALYYFQLATALFVYNIGENPFDQPGVEAYKKAMYRLLGKNTSRK